LPSDPTALSAAGFVLAFRKKSGSRGSRELPDRLRALADEVIE
jgi:hypothetical protein